MKRLWCILLACVIPSCGGNSTGPEPTPQYPEPLPVPHIELSYENLVGSWRSERARSAYGTQADSFISEDWHNGRWYFFGKYFLNDPYLSARGRIIDMHPPGSGSYIRFFFCIATLTTIKTDSPRTPYPSDLGRDTLRSPYPDWITQLDTILTLKYISSNNRELYRELFGLSDTTRSIEEQMISMSTAEFAALLDSLKTKNVAGQSQFLDQPGVVFQKARY